MAYVGDAPRCACEKPAKYEVTITTSDGPPVVRKICERWFESLIQVRKDIKVRSL